MLKIVNIEKINGHEFVISFGEEWIVGLFEDAKYKYQFAVFKTDNGIPNLHKGIVFTLGKIFMNGRGYPITNDKTNHVGLVTPENLTLKNFCLELEIQTAIARKGLKI